ncbi:gp1 [Streptomyces gancidicus BKS 13-15]|uniref:Gp1 n=1 Tax=Streptomyces gancidicus BKS 13-15 TaxID=1284664 RepID=M3DFI0_STREZ|nr:hypothetical protein [Streptomyces gancidicus]EMF20397.1 gp1 [Streptomyces gancidicus BKS 13-15]
MTQATYVRTDFLPLDQLTPFEGNAKVGNVPAILSSLRRNGQYRSLIIRDEGDGRLVILAGNHTAKALASHGEGPCDYRPKVGGVERPCGICQNQPWQPGARCEVITCDDDTARRINIADNRTADLGTYDQDALAELLSYLDDDFEGTGYSDDEVTRLVHTDLPEGFEEYGEEIADKAGTTSREPATAFVHTCPNCGHEFQTGATGTDA